MMYHIAQALACSAQRGYVQAHVFGDEFGVGEMVVKVAAKAEGEAAPITRGVLHLVVGPSGAGKDTLLAHARAARPDILFPARVITRPAEAGGEPHIPADLPQFTTMEAAGAFVLSWRAHGLAYGIPVAVAEALAAGHHVAINVSRAVIGAARARFGPVRVLMVTASDEVLARRLAGRGREGVADIAARLARSQPMPEGPDIYTIVNDGTPEEGAAALLAALAP